MLATVSTVLSGRRPLFCCFSFMNGSKTSRTQGSSRIFSESWCVPDFAGLDHWKVSTALICWFSQRCGEFSSDFPLDLKHLLSTLIFFGCFSNRVNLVNYLTITMVKNCLLFFMTSLKILRAIILVPDFFEEPPKLPQLRNSLRARKMVWITLIMALWAQMGVARWEKVLDGGVKRISVCVGQDWSSIHQITGKQWKMIQPKIVEINETSTNRNMGYVETRCGHQLPLK